MRALLLSSDISRLNWCYEGTDQRRSDRLYGRAHRIWVLDRGMVSEQNVAFLREGRRRYMVGTAKASLKKFEREQITIIGEVIGLPLRFEEISPEEARCELLSIMPPPIISMLLNAFAAAIGQPALVTSTVADITGTPARTFRDWIIDHTAEFRR